MNPKAGLTFATALRSILRADPDIAAGRARSATGRRPPSPCEAALTGHLVLSTLHTNDAASTPLRLLEMGVEPFLVTSAPSTACSAQRLARRLCERCREPYAPDAGELAAPAGRLGRSTPRTRPTFYRAVGCGACGKTGYRGRFAIHEVLLMTEDAEPPGAGPGPRRRGAAQAGGRGDAPHARGRPAQGRPTARPPSRSWPGSSSERAQRAKRAKRQAQVLIGAPAPNAHWSPSNGRPDLRH